MEYNTQRPLLKISEYGRNIEKLIEYACTIEDRETRNKVAQIIVSIMSQVNNPQRIDNDDFRQKIWDHLFMISNYKLDVDSPFPKPDPNVKEEIKFKCAYPNRYIKYRQYGKNVENMIKQAIEYPEGEEKEAMIRYIANHLKKLYLTWNRESVNDEVIFDHLATLSGGMIKLDDNTRLEATRDIIAMNNRKKTQNDKRGDNQSGRSRDRGRSRWKGGSSNYSNGGGNGNGMN